MRIIITPARDSDNSRPPDVEVRIEPDGGAVFHLAGPERTIRIGPEDWRSLVVATPRREPGA